MNRKIIIAVVVIGGSGVVNSIMRKQALTPVIIGSYILLLVLSVMDMFGPPLSSIAGAIAMLAVVYVLVGVDPTTGKSLFPWDTIIATLQGNTYGGGAGGKF